ncbi:MAG: putative 2OG-Fe(II) oxygenase [Solirubrobacteraceae bacterium]
MTIGPGSHWLWPTPIGLHRYAGAAVLNPLLVGAFAAGREAQRKKRGEEPRPFFASDDDLLHRVKLDEWQDFIGFLVASLGETARFANQDAWGGQTMELQVGIQGMWFQTSRAGAFHDVHTHGNCSWSAVYIVQIDEPEHRVGHPVYGAANGVTRLYGPHFATLGGAFVDVGNAYLQPPHVDIEPVPGQLLLFPSWLAHQALPYDGEKERIIISFNASLHGAEGDQLHGYSAV